MDPVLKNKPDFSKLIEYVKEGVAELAESGRTLKDFEHYVFEEVMEALYGASIWDWWNEHDKE